MNQHDIILLGLSYNKKHRYSPVQLQKLFFLIDRLLAKELGGPFFDFQPYHYGPFDKRVYNELTVLSFQGLVDSSSPHQSSFRTFSLTEAGYQYGVELQRALDPVTSDTIARLNSFVTSLSFSELVQAVYKEFPEMKSNSIFNQNAQ